MSDLEALPETWLQLLGLSVNPITAREVIDLASRAASQGERYFIGNHNLHSAYLVNHNEAFKEHCSRFDIRLVDGFPILLAASVVQRRWLGRRRRVGSMDWIPAAVASGAFASVAVVGASAISNALAVSHLSSLRAGVLVRGWDGERWTEARASSVAADLKAFAPSLVLVGLGMPLQERFLSERSNDLPRAVFATVGGAVDQLSGHQRAAPRWLGGFGIEWLWRLVLQPNRLAHRYLVEPFALSWAIGKQVIRRR